MMEIPKHSNKFREMMVNNALDSNVIDEFNVDFSSKPNLFSGVHAQNVASPFGEQSSRKKSKSKRLNAYDSELLYQEEAIKVDLADKSSKSIMGKSFTSLLKAFGSRLPIVNYFLLKDKKNKIKRTLDTLNSINDSVDEIINTSSPYGETDKYDALWQKIMEANNINSKFNNEL